MLAATLPVLRSRGLTALPVTYIGKAATFALMSGFPLILLGQWDALWSRVVLACGWAFLIWGLAHVPVVGRAVPDPGGDGDAPDCPGRRVSDDERLLGRLRPAKPAATLTRPTRPTLIPVPSLLRSLLSEHLDPGYAAAARSASAGAQAPDAGGRRGRGRSPARC